MNRTFYLGAGAIIVTGLLVFLGYNFLQTMQSTTSEDITNQTEEVTPTPETNSSLSYTLEFGSTSVLLKRSSDGNVAETFWNTPPTSVSVNGDLTSLYNRQDWANYLFYDTPKQAYYELEPGGNEKLSLVSEAYIHKKAAEKTTQIDDLSQTKLEKKCISKKVTLGSLANVWSVSCTNTTSDTISKEMLDTNTVTECYVPVSGTGVYLAYEVPVLPAGSETNLCNTLQSMKITSISKLAQ